VRLLVDTHLLIRWLAGLPKHHRDPFDRLLVAQRRVEAMLLLTQDQPLAAYGPSVLVAR
jgi:PIN domain nuclease of toxin-antitoxin system